MLDTIVFGAEWAGIRVGVALERVEIDNRAILDRKFRSSFQLEPGESAVIMARGE